MFYDMRDLLTDVERAYKAQEGEKAKEKEQDRLLRSVEEANRKYTFDYLDNSQPKDKSKSLMYMGVVVDSSWPVEKLFQLIHDLVQREARACGYGAVRGF